MQFPEIERGAAYFERNGSFVKIMTPELGPLALLNMRFCSAVIRPKKSERGYPEPGRIEILMVGGNSPFVVYDNVYYQKWVIMKHVKSPYSPSEILDELEKMLHDAMFIS